MKSLGRQQQWMQMLYELFQSDRTSCAGTGSCICLLRLIIALTEAIYRLLQFWITLWVITKIKVR